MSWPNWSLPLHTAILSNGGDWIDPQTGLLVLDKPEATDAIQKVFDLFLKEKGHAQRQDHAGAWA